MDNFLETNKLTKLTHEEIEILNKPIKKSKEIESIIKNLRRKKSSGLGGFPGEFYQMLKEELQILLKLCPKTKEKGTLPNTFTRLTLTQIPKPKKAVIFFSYSIHTTGWFWRIK